MASVGRLTSRALILTKNLTQFEFKRNLSSFRNVRNATKDYRYVWIIASGVAAFTAANVMKESTRVHALNIKREEEKLIKLTSRERRFIKFASVEFDGQLYMTPQDFLESVVEQEPRPRLKRRALTLQDINEIRDSTPQLKKGSSKMFRKLRDKGIVSYTEYLFLLSVLTKPTSGFRIAFNMFDTDGNQRVDKNEFLVIKRILGGSFDREEMDETTRKTLLSLVSSKEEAGKLLLKKKKDEEKVERIFSGAWLSKHGKSKEKTEDGPEEESEYVNDDEGLQRKHKVDTTLQIHLFGKKGNQDLHYEGFCKFMNNLQMEVLELEFGEFSKGNDYITEIDFAKILLRYTYLNTDEYDLFLERTLERFKIERGITFNEFSAFCRFLNNLDDFAIAMRMYTLADRAISPDEFSRAVKICTGFTLTPHVIETVFAIFDADGDGMLSYKEFIAIMKDRLHRGFKSVAKAEGWDAFKSCVKQDLRQNNSR